MSALQRTKSFTSMIIRTCNKFSPKPTENIQGYIQKKRNV